MIATLFFLFADGPQLLDTVIKFMPLEERYVRELITEFDRASRAVVLATLLSALAQGLLAGIGYQVAGVGSVFLLTLLTGMFAMVPFLGAASVWLSVSLWLYFFQGNATAAIGLAVYGALFVSMADNVIKPLVLHGQSNLHPLLALLSILGGVQALGPIGILVGPMSVVFLQVLVKILNREYKVFEQRVDPADHPAE
jgi:predicted PurR-regulated permease PerM